jgi:hypothetical protein
MLTKLYEEEPDAFDDVLVYPSNAFYPLRDDEHKYDAVNLSLPGLQHTWAVHRWHHLWLNPAYNGDDLDGLTPGGGEVEAEPPPVNGLGRYAVEAWRASVEPARVFRAGGGGAGGAVGAEGGLVWCQLALPAAASAQELAGLTTYGVTVAAADLAAVPPTVAVNAARLHPLEGARGHDTPWAKVSLGCAAVLPADLAALPARSARMGQVVAGAAGGGVLADVRWEVDALEREFHRVGPNCQTWPRLLTENPYQSPELGPRFGPTLCDLSLAAGEVFVFLAVLQQPGTDAARRDTFAAQLRSVAAGEGRPKVALAANIGRLESLDNRGWAQELRLAYLVLSSAAVRSGEARAKYRLGRVDVGQPAGAEALGVHLVVKFERPFPPAAAVPSIQLQTGNQPDTEYNDVHTAVLTTVTRVGFEAAIRRVDSVGEGWGQELFLNYLAWVN